MSRWPALIAAIVAVAIVAFWPRPPRMEIHWHQTCAYDKYGEPVNLCERKYWDC